MKKITFLILLSVIFVSVSFAADVTAPLAYRQHNNAISNQSTSLVNEFSPMKAMPIQTNNEATKENFGRECCEKSGTDSDGNVITIEACAGWFLSDSDAAHGRACDKANKALKEIIGDNF